MQRIAFLLLGLSLPQALVGQEAAGTALWRLAATTLPFPPALATGGAAAFWNPAQADGTARAVLGLDLIETPAAIGASGLVATARARVGRLGRVGAVYGRMGIDDLVRTSSSPDPDGPRVPFFTAAIGATWARDVGRSTLGATLAYHQTQLDNRRDDRWTIDVGARRAIGGRVRLAAATHFFSHWTSSDPAQDLYGAVEFLVWRGPLWTAGPAASVLSRYGVALAHRFEADHLFGAGLEVGNLFAADLMLAREGSYGNAGWRPVGGVRVLVGKYRIAFARDAGVNDIGSAFRVGLEARVR
ncbi:MAG: hypothetical protein HYS40_02750 [Gemmatimonadetes bacterium]|nr:hypothetical protein [Gemmatimonadota bacterium]